MFVGRGVKGDRWPMSFEDLEHGVGVPNVNQYLLMGTGQERGGIMEVGFVPVEEDDEFRVELVHLSGDLGADRTSCPRDQDPTGGQRLTHGVEVGGDRLTPEEVFEAKGVRAAHRSALPPAGDVPYAGEEFHGHPGRLGGQQRFMHQGRRRRGDGQEHLVESEAVPGGRDGGYRTDDRHALQGHSMRCGVVIEDRHRNQTGSGVVQHVPHRRCAGVTAADDGDAHAGCLWATKGHRQPATEEDCSDTHGGDHGP